MTAGTGGHTAAGREIGRHASVPKPWLWLAAAPTDAERCLPGRVPVQATSVIVRARHIGLLIAPERQPGCVERSLRTRRAITRRLIIVAGPTLRRSRARDDWSHRRVIPRRLLTLGARRLAARQGRGG